MSNSATVPKSSAWLLASVTHPTPSVQRFDGDGRGAEEERLVRVGPRFAAVGDGALEVEDEQVGLVCGGNDAVREERCRGHLGEVLGNLAAEHRVAGEGELHRTTSSLSHDGARSAARVRQSTTSSSEVWEKSA